MLMKAEQKPRKRETNKECSFSRLTKRKSELKFKLKLSNSKQTQRNWKQKLKQPKLRVNRWQN